MAALGDRPAAKITTREFEGSQPLTSPLAEHICHRRTAPEAARQHRMALAPYGTRSSRACASEERALSGAARRRRGERVNDRGETLIVSAVGRGP